MTRKTFIRSILAVAGVAGVYKLFFEKPEKTIMSAFTSNPKLKTINPEWKGTPLDQEGRFINHEFPLEQSMGDLFKWFTISNPNKEFKKKDTWRMPVIKNDAFLSDETDKLVMLGHASMYIQLGGKRILIDPVFGDLPTNKRFSELPIAPEKLVNIDYILVSHAHYDHCDKASIKLLSKQNPNAKILTGLKLDKLLSTWVNNPIEAAGWYQQYSLTDGLEITFVPSRHWANRGLLDKNTTLWGGFVIKSGDKTIYFGGDSGYGSHFKDIGALFPNIDVAMIGAGAYSPEWFMAQNHQNPEHAVQAFNDTQAKTFVPFHYGTFDLSDEPLGESEQILTQQNQDQKVNGTLKIMKLGEVLEL